MSSWTAASSDCSRPVNNYVHVKTADLYRPNARLTPERQGYQVLTPFGKLGYSQFSESLSNEVTRSGVQGTALCPGFTRSKFHDVTGTRAAVRELPSWLWMDATQVAREGFDAVMAGAPIHVTGRVNRTIVTLARCVPNRVLVALGRRTARRYRKV